MADTDPTHGPELGTPDRARVIYNKLLAANHGQMITVYGHPDLYRQGPMVGLTEDVVTVVDITGQRAQGFTLAWVVDVEVHEPIEESGGIG